MDDAETNEARPTVSFRFRNGTRNEMVEKYATFVILILCEKSQDRVDGVSSFCWFWIGSRKCWLFRPGRVKFDSWLYIMYYKRTYILRMKCNF